MKLKSFAAAAAAVFCLCNGSAVLAAEHPMFDKVMERYQQNMTWQQMKEQTLSKEQLFIAEKNGRFGVLDRKGSIILPIEYDRIRRLDDTGILLKKDGMTGVSDCKGQIIVPLQYKRVRQLKEGFWLVRDRGWGILDASGTVLLPCIYEKIIPGQDKFFVRKDGKEGVLAADGSTVISCDSDSVADDGAGGYIVGSEKGFRYYTADRKLRSEQFFAEAGRFSENLASVKTDSGWGYMDMQGKMQLEPVYVRAAAFSEGLAFVVQDAERVFIDKTGKNVCPAPEGRYIRGFKDGLAVFKDDGAFHFINTSGQEQFAIRAATFKKLDNGMYQITRTRHNVSLGGILQSAFTMVAGIPTIPGVGKSVYDTVLKRGYTDSRGQMLIPTRNDFNSAIIDNRVVSLVDDKPAYCALNGSYLVPPVFDDVSETDLDSGNIVVVTAEDGSGFYTLGSGMAKGGYHAAENFVNGLAPVKVTQSRWNYVDRQFKQVMWRYWTEATPFYGEFAVVRNTKGRYCIIDRSGEVRALLKENIEEAGPLQPDTAIIKESGKWGIIDRNGRYIASPEYDSLQRL